MASLTGTDGSGSGITPSSSFGVLGDSALGQGVLGTSGGVAGVIGINNSNSTESQGAGVDGQYTGTGIGYGVRGLLRSPAGGAGVLGQSLSPDVPGVLGKGEALAIRGVSTAGTGVHGESTDGTGVSASSQNGYGIFSSGGDIAIYAENRTRAVNHVYLGTRGLAADIYGDVWVTGHLHKPGGGFIIDHPTDPENQYLEHSFVESSQRKNLYDGIVTLDKNGEATVALPKWFEDINGEFCYQLTCLGRYAPIFIASEIRQGKFRIAGGTPGLKVCWMITCVRQDPWAKANPLLVESKKTANEKGHYLHPNLYRRSEDQSIRVARYGKAVDRLQSINKRANNDRKHKTRKRK